MSEQTQLERLTAARERIAAAMGWRCVGRDTDCSASLVISREADFAEAIAERLERRKVRLHVIQEDRCEVGDREFEDCNKRCYFVMDGEMVATTGTFFVRARDAIEAARRVAEQLGLEVVE